MRLSDFEMEFYHLNDAYSSTYTYKDEDGLVEMGKSLRSRLMGISIKKGKPRHQSKIISKALAEFNEHINRSGRFVKYEITGCDIYRRVIVKIFDPVTGKCLNDIFMQHKYSSVFEVYAR